MVSKVQKNGNGGTHKRTALKNLKTNVDVFCYRIDDFLSLW